jgi:predicted enzyme related to lactoylglutathione lyase
MLNRARHEPPRQSNIAETMAMPHAHPVVHLELHTGDLPRAAALYEELCGWRRQRIETRDGSYLYVGLGVGFGGGIVECDSRRPVWLPYVEVPEVAEATDRAGLLGASVLLEPREGPAGWRSVVTSPAGGEIAFWQPKGPRRPERWAP